jgi:phosphoglycolate phosphatase-like HAD superfamily hydrolase
MSDNLEQDYQRVVRDVGPTRRLPGTQVEIVREVRLADRPEHAVFDFDGTLSLIREGWPEVMVPMMVEVLQETGTSESADELSRLAYEFVMRLTGKQTIYQMLQLAEEVKQRGGRPRPPLEYKQMYHARLMERIESRRQDLRDGRVAPADMMVPGSCRILDALGERGVRLYLASGTDQQYVREEAELLGLSPYFQQHVYGAVDDYQSFSKAQVIQRILQENRVDGSRLLGFGDGYVEIQNVKAVGGTAIAVASDEAGRSGKPDPWKRDRLIGVGADLVIPDFQHSEAVVAYLWNRPAAAERS